MPILHVVWFGVRVGVNVDAIREINSFDPFPFPFLTMTESLEAIVLALFVLASQNRLALQPDKRSHLDLQIDLLAERGMTAALHCGLYQSGSWVMTADPTSRHRPH